MGGSRPTPEGGLAHVPMRRYGETDVRDQDDPVVVEEPLEIRISGDTFAVTMRTPGHDRELAAGLLFAEGVIRSRDDLGGLTHCGRPGDDGYGNTLEVSEAPGLRLDTERVSIARRGTLTTSACGVCGRRTIEDLLERCAPLDDTAELDVEVLRELTARLRREQPVFHHTGGLHAAGIADADGKLGHVREDVGRHNAVDKVIGRMLLDAELPARGKVLVVSGRTSFEIVQKTWLAGFSALVAVSAPTSLAVETARRANLTLIGFSRGGTFNVYAGSDRIKNP
jgi:FdhD protein